MYGVPMGLAYDDLPAKSQELLASAKWYDSSVRQADFGLDRLTSGVPDDHPKMSEAVRRLGRDGSG